MPPSDPQMSSSAALSPFSAQSKNATVYSNVGMVYSRSGLENSIPNWAKYSCIFLAFVPSVSRMDTWSVSFTTASTVGFAVDMFSKIPSTPPPQSMPCSWPYKAGRSAENGMLKLPNSICSVTGPEHGTRLSFFEQNMSRGQSTLATMADGWGTTPFHGATATTPFTRPGDDAARSAAALMPAPPPIECPAMATDSMFGCSERKSTFRFSSFLYSVVFTVFPFLKVVASQ
mmetsp:Transcript_355/g.814  ORF Transcript_355/g.814 Transcript_355/m.814 type:complete len:230 (-) Transcript_355:472-1161(-)